VKSIEDSIVLVATMLANKPQAEFDEMLEAMRRVSENDMQMATVIDVKVRLDDQQSRVYETLKILMSADDLKAVSLLLVDGISVDSYVLLGALQIAIKARGDLGDDDPEED